MTKTNLTAPPEPDQARPGRLKRLGHFFFRFRSFTPIPLILLMLWYAHPSWLSIGIGVSLLVIGELGRLWAVGYAGSSTRTRSLGAARDLVTTGPYAHVRNPLYLSNGLISLGVCVLSGVYWLVPLLLLGYALQYVPVIASEEDYLLRTCGQDYATYCAQVPRWWLKWTPYQHASDHDFSWHRALCSERRTLLAIVVVCVLLALRGLWKIA